MCALYTLSLFFFFYVSNINRESVRDDGGTGAAASGRSREIRETPAEEGRDRAANTNIDGCTTGSVTARMINKNHDENAIKRRRRVTIFRSCVPAPARKRRRASYGGGGRAAAPPPPCGRINSVPHHLCAAEIDLTCSARRYPLRGRPRTHLRRRRRNRVVLYVYNNIWMCIRIIRVRNNVTYAYVYFRFQPFRAIVRFFPPPPPLFSSPPSSSSASSSRSSRSYSSSSSRFHSFPAFASSFRSPSLPVFVFFPFIFFRPLVRARRQHVTATHVV